MQPSIGCTPADILFGNSISLQRDMFLPCKMIKTEEIQLSKWTSKRLTTKQATSITKKAQYVLNRQTEKHMSSASSKRTEYEIGSFVLVEQPENACPAPRLSEYAHAISDGTYVSG